MRASPVATEQMQMPLQDADRFHQAQVNGSVKAWGQDAASGSAKAAHAYLRTGNLVKPLQLAEDVKDGASALDPAWSVEARADTWAKCWRRDDAKASELARTIQGLRITAKSEKCRMDELDDDEIEEAIDGLRNSRSCPKKPRRRWRT